MIERHYGELGEGFDREIADRLAAAREGSRSGPDVAPVSSLAAPAVSETEPQAMGMTCIVAGSQPSRRRSSPEHWVGQLAIEVHSPHPDLHAGTGPGTLPRAGSRARVPSSAREKLQVRAGASRPFVMTGTALQARGPVGVPSPTTGSSRPQPQ